MKPTIAQFLKITKFPFTIKENGNITYIENSNGYWNRREYDSNGNVTYYEDSLGHWTRREYDSNGNVTYYENSNGEIKGTKRTSCEGRTVVIDGITYKLIKE